MTVYHHTNTARLPWILRSGELRPGRSTVGGYPDPDFLWATTSAKGDRSASGMLGSATQLGWRDGRILQVRFALHAADFEPWAGVTTRYPVWTGAQVTRLEATSKGSNPADWRIRTGALPRSRWLGIEARSYFNPNWFAVADEWFAVDDRRLGVRINGAVYVSAQVKAADGRRAYSIEKRAA